MPVEIDGVCDPQFKAVKDAFYLNFRMDEDIGAACSVYMHGEKVVDLWGGYADQTNKTPWQEDTLCCFYSSGKPLIGLSLLRMVDEGRIKLDDPVCSVWPEFGSAGKESITFRHLLCHQAGMPAIRKRLPNEAVLDWDLLTRELAAQEPWWEPGSRHVYHTHMFGFLTAEPVRRLTGLTPGEYFSREIAGPLAEEVYFGVPDHALPRLAEIYTESMYSTSDRPVTTTSPFDRPMDNEEKMLLYAAANPPGFPGGPTVGKKEWIQAQIPSTNGHGTARGIAHFYAVLALGGQMGEVKLVSEELLQEATKVQSEGYCPSLKRNVSFGLGFQITRPDRPFGSAARSFGHYGNGGSVGFADPDTGVGFGYVMNYVNRRLQNSRNKNLMTALYTCL